MSDAQHHALLELMLVPGLGHGRIRRGVDQLGSAQAMLQASGSQLATIPGIPRKLANDIRRTLDSDEHQQRLHQQQQLIDTHHVTLLSMTDPAYPTLLRHIPDPPMMLWMRGQLTREDTLALAIVGARRCTHYGREQAERFAYQGAQAGLTIVSGGAYGIDAAAHRGALKARGRTIAVIGSGLAKPYPADHAQLFDQIIHENAGAIISEMPMDCPPIAENFPRRNRIISGLSLGVLVVEAAARSGALITARLCVEEHGRECMAIPGRVDAKASEGCHRMIREGWAKLVTNPAEVLDALGETGEMLKTGMTYSPDHDATDPHAGGLAGGEAGGKVGGDGDNKQTLFDRNLSTVQRKIIDLLDEPRSLDQLITWSQLAAQQVQSELTMLEIQGRIKRQGALFVKRKG